MVRRELVVVLRTNGSEVLLLAGSRLLPYWARDRKLFPNRPRLARHSESVELKSIMPVMMRMSTASALPYAMLRVPRYALATFLCFVFDWFPFLTLL